MQFCSKGKGDYIVFVNNGKKKREGNGIRKGEGEEKEKCSKDGREWANFVFAHATFQIKHLTTSQGTIFETALLVDAEVVLKIQNSNKRR